MALILATGAEACSRTFAASKTDSHSTKSTLITTTEAALLDQMKCHTAPKVSLAINAMIRNRLIRYADNESGVYLFSPTEPLTFLGLRITHVAGFDYQRFREVPGSTMVGTAPPVFLEIDVAAPEAELRKRALGAHLVEAIPGEDRRGFTVSAGGSYLAGEPRTVTSKIECEA